MNKKKKMAPELRFPEFQDDWEQRKLGELSEKITKKNQDVAVEEVFTNSAEYGIISQREFFDKDIANSDNIDGYYVVAPDDFVYNPRISTSAPFGPIKRNKLERTGAMSPLYYVFRPHDIDLDYLEWFFQTTCWHTFMRFNGNSGARSDRYAITDKIFNELPITMPQDIDEQKVIGEFLTRVDTLITLHQRKLDAMKEYKKGLLQKMFPKKGEKVPELRFPGFTDDWEQRKFGEITDIKSASRVHKEEWTSSGVPFYRSSDVMSALNGTDNTKAYISEELYEKLSAVSGKLEKGDILVTGGGSVGNPYRVPDNAPLYTKDADLLWVKRNIRLNPDFVYQFFLSPLFRDYISSISHVGTIAHYTITQLENTPIALPSIEEQKQIGEFLTALDNTVTLHQRKLDNMKEYKKGLLQKMFV